MRLMVEIAAACEDSAVEAEAALLRVGVLGMSFSCSVVHD